jgi:hypothetical protein
MSKVRHFGFDLLVIWLFVAGSRLFFLSAVDPPDGEESRR